MDFVAYPSTIDFFGPAGKSFARQTQIRWTSPSGFSVSLENPETVGAGAAGSWATHNLGHKVVANDFAPGFMIEHMAKDLGIAVSEAERLGLELPGLANARRLYDALLAAGHGRDGTQALVLALDSPTNPAVSPCR